MTRCDINIGMRKKQRMPPKSKKGKGQELTPPKAIADLDWLNSRIKLAGIRSQRDLNARMFQSIGVLSRRLAGDIRWNFDEVVQLASLIKEPLDETARRLGFELPVQTTEVIGVVRPDARVSMVTARSGEKVRAAPGSDLTLRALIFETATGQLSGYHGMALHYRPTKGVDAEAHGRLAVIEVEGEPMAVVGALERGQRGALRVTLLTGDKIEGHRVLSAAAIEGIMKP